MPQLSPPIQAFRNVAPRLDETLLLTTGDDTEEIMAAVAALPNGHPMTEATEPGEWEFRYLGVRKDHWGQGLGTLLIAAVEERARSNNAERIVLRVVETTREP
jgi:Acetyltransferases